MSFWRSLLATIARNPISFFAVLCVAATGIFLAYMAVWQTKILSSPDWCNRAVNAEKLAEGSRLDAALACVGLQKIQIEALALDSHINQGGFVLVLIFLVVVVIAGARASFKVSMSGIEGDVGRDAAKAADKVADAAVDEAEKIREHKGPTMPEPKP